MVFAVSCAHKKPAPDTGELSPAISNDPMGLSPEGSDSGKIAGLSTVHFEFDRAALDQKAMETLKQNAEWIGKHPDIKMQIEGHADERGSTEYNLALGERRAHAVVNVLVEMGIPKARLSTISYGEEKPVAPGSTEEAYAQNRRANFVPLRQDSAPAAPIAGH
jgi:peptidoglycan-associated lipoprotein